MAKDMVKGRGTKPNAKKINRSPRMRLACKETTQAALFAGLPRFKRKRISLKRPWDKRRTRSGASVSTVTVVGEQNGTTYFYH